MSDEGPRELDWPTRRWLMWGLLALVALAVIIALVIWFGNAKSSDDTIPEVGPQFEWSIVLTDQTGDTVTLKGDEPLGFPTETWQNDFQVARSVGATFEWDLDAQLPVAVVEIDSTTDCAALNQLLAGWVTQIGSVQGSPDGWQARAFAQHTLNKMRTSDCQIDDAVLSGL